MYTAETIIFPSVKSKELACK